MKAEREGGGGRKKRAKNRSEYSHESKKEGGPSNFPHASDPTVLEQLVFLPRDSG